MLEAFVRISPELSRGGRTESTAFSPICSSLWRKKLHQSTLLSGPNVRHFWQRDQVSQFGMHSVYSYRTPSPHSLHYISVAPGNLLMLRGLFEYSFLRERKSWEQPTRVFYLKRLLTLHSKIVFWFMTLISFLTLVILNQSVLVSPG